MDYADAIKWLNEHGVKKDVVDENNVKIGETDYVFGEDIPESPERRMTVIIFLLNLGYHWRAYFALQIPNGN